MRVRLTEAEWYPVLTPHDREDWMTDKDWDEFSVDVPDGIVELWRAAKRDLDAACEALMPHFNQL